MNNDSTSALEGIPGLLKMAGTLAIASAIPLGAGVAVQEIKHGGLWAIVVCFSVIAAMSALGFFLIVTSGLITKRIERMRSDSEP
ncbi:MAG TPA: hypothetical protein VFV87_17130 [Pirellulaceae bacterium]|nr:hypothetical protein [Pirellulaceae bacterium]